MQHNTTATQFIRYAIVGLGSNLVLYLGYIGLTRLGLGPKVSMTLLYAIGTLQTFWFNKHWSFRHQGARATTFVRYCLSYCLGYLLNLFALYLLVDQQGFPHQIVQGVMVLALAVLLFVLQKLWIFRI